MTRPDIALRQIGERIVRARNARKISQSELARRLGKADSTVSGYETGTVEMSTSTLISAARILGTSVAALVGEMPDPKLDLNTLPTPSLIAGIDLSDMTDEEQMLIGGIVTWLKFLYRQRRAPGEHANDRS